MHWLAASLCSGHLCDDPVELGCPNQRLVKQKTAGNGEQQCSDVTVSACAQGMFVSIDVLHRNAA